ncbi:META domain-containing protein [Oceanisphaera avium]|uniref:DUF306 domain-containing protein n=1 Tax=Oceanisphaera avium TaxID=1903694 RepID=A0A1Y0D066_9GAMM|nr:META domain-containing protein [Oceanisphaera avium]ART80969.1 hypothetical protein CBP12_13065 [Oceanisphaera avium]
MKSFTSFAWLSAAAVTVISGCADPNAASEQHQLTGSLSYLSRIALAPESVAQVRIKDTSVANGKVIAEQKIDLDKQQLPIPFTLELKNHKLDAGTYSLSALIKEQGQVTWRSSPIGVTGKPSDIALGNLELHQVHEGEFNGLMQCGEQRIHLAFSEEHLDLRVGEQRFNLEQVRAASGARYQASDDANTELWNKGANAQLKIKGNAYPECVSTTQALLQGGEWQVVDLNGEDMRVPSEAEQVGEGTLNFSDDGRVFGQAFCNNLTGSYQLTGDKLSTSQLAGTMMLCADAQMQSERTMLEILGQAQRIEFSDSGELIIFAKDGRTITAK